MIPPKPSNPFDLQFIQQAKCELGLLYPYHPILTFIDLNKQVYLATRHYETIAIMVVSNRISKSYTLETTNMPPSTVSALQFVQGQYVQNLPASQPPLLYLLIGYLHGFLILVRCKGSSVTILKRFNKDATEEPSGLYKTLSFLNGNQNTLTYSPWQKSPVMKITSRREVFAYSQRNSVLVCVNSLAADMSKLQSAFQEMRKPQGKKEKLTVSWYACKDWQMVCSREGVIFEFTSNVSTYHLAEEKLFVANFDGELLTFDRATMGCLEKITVGSTIRSLNHCYRYLILCLQDDSIQLIEQGANITLKVLGHKSFPSRAQVVDISGVGLALLATSLDGCLSLTRLPTPNYWSSRKRAEVAEMYVDIVFGLAAHGQEGLGTFIVVRDIIITATFDNCIKIYKLVAR